MQLTPRIITPPERRLDDSVQLTPRVLTPPEKERSPWSFVPSPLTKFMKRKAPQPLISLKPKKSKNSSPKKSADFKCKTCSKVFSKKYNAERHVNRTH